MTRLDAAWIPSEHGLVGVGSGTTDESVLGGHEVAPRRVAWDQMVERKLNDWSSDPDRLADEDEDEDIQPPSPESIAQAGRIARIMRDRDSVPPTAVVPNGEGGIVLECARGPVFKAIEIDAVGSIEYRLFDDCRLVRRETLG